MSETVRVLRDRNDDTTCPEIKSVKGKRIVIELYQAGFPEKRIAALFDENQGRVAEVIRESRRSFRRAAGE
jgi:hypothetical protein